MNPNNGHRTKQVSRPLTPTHDREMLWHALATQHLQRVRIIELLGEINAKLAILVDVALRNERTLR